MRIRCSSLPLFFSCPSSLQEWKTPISTTGEGAELGVAVHAALAIMVENPTALTDDTLPALSALHCADLDELTKLCNYGDQAWLDLAKHFVGTIDVEREFEQAIGLVHGIEVLVLTGHADVSCALYGLDFKSGRKEPRNSEWQVLGYARLAGWRGAWLVWLRERELEYVEAMQPEEFDAAITAQVALIGKRYCPGEHCIYCQGREECPARDAEIKGAVNALSIVCKPVEGALTLREKLGRLYPYLGTIEGMVNAVRTAARTLAREGPLDLGNGSELVLEDYTQDEIDPEKGWNAITDALGDDTAAVARCVKITKSALEEEVGAKAEKGQKAKNFRALMGALAAAGAVTKLPRTKLVARKQEDQ